MTVADVEMKGGIDLELRALQWLYGTWLPRSGLVPDDQPGFEAFVGRPFAHGGEYFELNLQVPVRRG
jgi:AraC family transcriptional regulator